MSNNRALGARIGTTPRAIAVNCGWAVSGLAIVAWTQRAGDWCVLAAARRHQREALRGLNDRLLRDIGRTCREAEVEAAKPFWR